MSIRIANPQDFGRVAAMMGGTSRVSLPEVNSSRLTALPSSAMPSSTRTDCFDSMR